MMGLIRFEMGPGVLNLAELDDLLHRTDGLTSFACPRVAWCHVMDYAPGALDGVAFRALLREVEEQRRL